jgi:hypothetical protein
MQSLLNARGERRDQGPLVVLSSASIATTTRRSSTNAPQRAGALQRKAAMSAPV